MRIQLPVLWLTLSACAPASNLAIPPATLALTGLAVLGPSLLAALACWLLLARHRRYAPYLVLVSWLAGSMIAFAYQLLRAQPDWSPASVALPGALSSAALFSLLIALNRHTQDS